MENEGAILPSPLRESTFDQVMRGYHRGQVDDFVAATRQRINGLEQQLSATTTQTEQLRRELQDTRERYGAKPAHAEVSERLSQILRLAAEEADQERAKAEADIANNRQAAEQESQRVLTQARGEYERMVTAAREEAERVLGAARAESERLLTNAHEESKRLATTARGEAERLLDDAQRRAASINDDSTRRLSQLTSSHNDAVGRLSEIRDIIGDLLLRDSAAGALTEAVPPVPEPISTEDVLGPELVDEPQPLPPAEPAEQVHELPDEVDGDGHDDGLDHARFEPDGPVTGQFERAAMEAEMLAEQQARQQAQGRGETLDEAAGLDTGRHRAIQDEALPGDLEHEIDLRDDADARAPQ